MNPPSATKRLRVLHYVTRLGLGGAEAVAQSIVRGLRDEFDFAVFAIRGVERSDIGHAMRDELATLRVPLFTGSRVPIKLGGMLVAGLHAMRVSREFQPDVIHLHTEIPESAFATMITLRPSCAPPLLVRTIHNCVYWHFWPQLGRWCERRMVASHVAGVSQDATTAFETHRRNSGVGPVPVAPVVIYNGVAGPEIFRREPRSPEGRRRILFAGRFELQKGTDLIPGIVSHVKPPAGGCELILHGHGSHARALNELALRPPPGWQINVRPPVANLGGQMHEFDLMIMPSRFEGLGLVAVEAMLAGLPVIGTDAPGLREALPPDYPWRARLGDAVSFAEQLQRALDDPATWPPAIEHGRRFARDRFDPAKMFTAYRALYARAAGRPQ